MEFELKDVTLFSRLSKEQLETLQFHVHVRHYSKDSVLFYEGDKSAYLQILLGGTVRLYKTTAKGSQIHMHHFTAPEIVALYAAFEKVSFPATCEFLTDGMIGFLPLEKVYELLGDSDFSMTLISVLTKRMKLLSDLFHRETIYTSEAKIADVICNNPTVFSRLKNTEIASILNITPETLSRTLTKFKNKKMISIDHHVLTILQKDALIEIIEANIISKH
ncbi:Crp/Fnr family transcriptional regulator [Sulfurovum sp.]|uniref:Crp/Fnr family transcriptional regulator n=1 Tax=Sulfurovum sp. TaxID=1969726 RepID=UPI0025F6ED50|nr:Crp/Fnr family transcriptional regulator [Sulfurovum sp.]